MTEIRKIGDHDRLVRLVEAEVKSGRLTKNTAARQIGVSAATLSLWLSGTYAGNNARVDKKAERWLAYRSETERLNITAAGLDAHRDLSITEEIGAALANGHVQGDIVLIYGPSGSGKSFAAAHYGQTHSATYSVQMTGAVRTIPGMLSRVTEAVDAAPSGRSALAAEAAIIERLRNRDALLIVDEAHHLAPLLLDELRAIRDIAGVGLALIGDPKLRATIHRCPQIAGRVGVIVDAPPPRQADVIEIIAGVLRREPTRKDIETCCRAAALPGGLHTLRRTLSSAWIDAQIQNLDTVPTQALVDAVGDAAQPLGKAVA